MAAIDLTTIANVREWIPVPANTPSPSQLAIQNSVLQSAITALSIDFLRRTGRLGMGAQIPAQSHFNQAVSYSEVYDGNGNPRLFLRNTPIISVQSLTVFGNAIQQSTGAGLAGWAIDSTGKSIVLLSAGPGFPFTPILPLSAISRFPRGTQNVAIAYTAGFNAAAVTNEQQTIPSSAPYTVAPDLPLIADGGVKYFSNGNPFTPVQIAPAQGQYFLQNNGQYLFNAADAGQNILLAYTGAGTPADLELAARKTVFLVYQRRGWEGLASLAKPESGQTSYTKWELAPDVVEVLRNYTRMAIA